MVKRVEWRDLVLPERESGKYRGGDVLVPKRILEEDMCGILGSTLKRVKDQFTIAIQRKVNSRAILAMDGFRIVPKHIEGSTYYPPGMTVHPVSDSVEGYDNRFRRDSYGSEEEFEEFLVSVCAELDTVDQPALDKLFTTNPGDNDRVYFGNQLAYRNVGLERQNEVVTRIINEFILGASREKNLMLSEGSIGFQIDLSGIGEFTRMSVHNTPQRISSIARSVWHQRVLDRLKIELKEIISNGSFIVNNGHDQLCSGNSSQFGFNIRYEELDHTICVFIYGCKPDNVQFFIKPES